METAYSQQVHTKLGMCSNIMRDPTVFDQLRTPFGNLARDIAIHIAMQRHQEATLNVQAFIKLFGYTKGFVFKPLDTDKLKELKRLGFGPEIKDVLGYTLAKLTVQNLVFANKYLAVGLEGQEEVKSYNTLSLIKKLNVHTSSKGTYYSFHVSRTFLANCQRRFQTFVLEAYLNLRTGRGNAYSAARKLYLHLVWKRRVWDTSKKQAGVKPSMSIYAELVRVAGIDRKDPARAAHELRELLVILGDLPGVRMAAEVEWKPETGSYTVQFKRDTRQIPLFD